LAFISFIPVFPLARFYLSASLLLQRQDFVELTKKFLKEIDPPQFAKGTLDPQMKNL